MTDRDKIRAEVERLFNEIKESKKECDSGAFYCLKNVLDFIDTLKQEPVSESQSREQEIIKASDAYIEERGYYTGQLDAAFIEGAEWADEHPTKEPVSEDLEEAIEKSFIYHETHGDDFRSDKQITTAYRYGFEAGAKWQKEQMMSKAIDADVVDDRIGEATYLCPHTKATSDKAKVIIIEEG